MDTIRIPDQLPATVTRPRELIEAVMGQSLHEQGPDSRTASAWRWVLTGYGPTPVSSAPGIAHPPSPEEIATETQYGRDTNPPQWVSWPPWRYAFDRDPDRQQARRVLRWLTGAADAIPLLDLNRGRYVGARLYLARTDNQLRQVRGWALHGLHEHGDLPGDISLSQAEHPWQWPKPWMNAAWLRGTIAYLDWILGDQATTPVTWNEAPIWHVPPSDRRVIAGQREMYGVSAGRRDIEEEIWVHAYCAMQQGREGQEPAEPTRWPPPQWCEAVVQAHDWAIGEDSKPPADHHGCGDYYPCPDLLRCTCEAAGHCLHDQCPACGDQICNAGWQVIVNNY